MPHEDLTYYSGGLGGSSPQWPPEKEPFIQTPRFYSFKRLTAPKDLAVLRAGHTTSQSRLLAPGPGALMSSG